MRTWHVAFGRLGALVVCACGGGDELPGRDWSNASLLERVIDFCVKQAACTETLVSVAECVRSAPDLAAFAWPPPKRRELEQLLQFRGCYNRARTCKQVQDCAGVSTDPDPVECNPETFGRSCRQEMGVSLSRSCVNGVVVTTDCTKQGLVCGFDADGTPMCADETCVPRQFRPECDEQGGHLRFCEGSLITSFECGALGMGCDVVLADDPQAGDAANCVAPGDECDPMSVAPSCTGAELEVCWPNLDQASGNLARWDCATGEIHRTCLVDEAEGSFGCGPTLTDCDPALDQGSCDGDRLLVCIDGALMEIDCGEHGLSDCKAGTPALCSL